MITTPPSVIHSSVLVTVFAAIKEPYMCCGNLQLVCPQEQGSDSLPRSGRSGLSERRVGRLCLAQGAAADHTRPGEEAQYQRDGAIFKTSEVDIKLGL